MKYSNIKNTRTNFKSIIIALESNDEPVIVTVLGKPRAVMISMATWQHVQDILARKRKLKPNPQKVASGSAGTPPLADPNDAQETQPG